MSTMRMKQISPTMFSVGEKYSFKIYFQISDSKMLVLINADTIIDQEDIDKMTHYVSQSKKLLLEKSEYEKFITSQAPTKGKIASPLAKQFAVHCLERDENLNDKAYLDEIVTSTTNIINNLINQQSSNKQSSVLMDLLKEMNNADNEFLTHSAQTFALATTFLFLQPNAADLTYLYELGTSALLHSYALNHMNCPGNSVFATTILKEVSPLLLKSPPADLKRIVAAHTNGHQLASFDEITTYIESFTIMEHAANFLKAQSSTGLKKLIQDYKLLQIPKTLGLGGCNNAYLPAKILLIADHVLSMMNLTILNSPDNITDNLIVDSLNQLKERSKEDRNSPEYDLSIIRNIEKQLCQ